MDCDRHAKTRRVNDRRPSYPGDEWVKKANTTTKTWVKVAMGIAYFLCVSVAAFVLAIYYVFFWSSDGSSNSTVTEINGTCRPR